MTANTPIEDWPEVLTPAEVAVILRRSEGGVRTALSKGAMWPPTIPNMDKPRWRKSVLVAYVNGQLPRRTR